MSKKLCDFHGLETLLEQLKAKFATKKAVADVKNATDGKTDVTTDNYIFGTGSIDYETELKFDSDEIISF